MTPAKRPRSKLPDTKPTRKETATKYVNKRTPVASCAGKYEDSMEAGEDMDKNKSKSTLLVELVAAAELWHTAGQGKAYATLLVAGHREHLPIRSAPFRRWLSRQFFKLYGKVPSSQAMTDAITVVEGQAIFDGPEYPVYVRLAGNNNKLYLDLANETWQVVEIDGSGWRILEADQVPVRFRRAKAMMSLPTPTAGGNIGEIRQFVNVTNEDWPLLLGWLVGAFRDKGPYPILALHGEQGSAKSTSARTLRSIIDPNAAPLRCEPRNQHDLMIAAHNGWVVAFDNLSFIPGSLSDGLCRLATGGGFATRTLYENDEETIFDSMRPAILTGIEELASRSDLLDRSLVLQLPRIPSGRRRTEAEHWREFGLAHGQILGAALDAVSVAVRNLPTTHIKELPRMADFALWVTAAEPGLGLPPGTFLDAYQGNRDAANEVALESSPVAKYILEVANAGEWQGMSSELLGHIESMASENDKRLNGWPKDARCLSGTLKRLAPNLRVAGVEIEFGNKGRDKQKRRSISIRKSTELLVPCVPTVPDREEAVFCGGEADASILNEDAIGLKTGENENPSVTKSGTQGDGGDASLQTCSNRVRVTI